jgi:hypothetical protein
MRDYNRRLNPGKLRLLQEAVYWYKAYTDCNPDVGMGPSIESQVDDVAKRVGLHLSIEDKAAVVAWVKTKGDA